MPITVPTQTEFDALVSRVDALEGTGSAPPSNGILARRIVDLISQFGCNTFSSMDEHNVWGSWPANYQPESVIAGLRWLVQDSGHTISVREYHRSSRRRAPLASVRSGGISSAARTTGWRGIAAAAADVPGAGWVEEFDLTLIAANKIADGYAPAQAGPASRITVRLDGSARVLRISG